mmetsp:Transcript_10747/g.35746  ORF Transcript_10747/g.35746 Transcript_10747/m.35746 type:complete len:201 (+) Transcript_10747:1367-1969(+)
MSLYQSSFTRQATIGISFGTCCANTSAPCVSTAHRSRAAASSFKGWDLSLRPTSHAFTSASECAPSKPGCAAHKARSMPYVAAFGFSPPLDFLDLAVSCFSPASTAAGTSAASCGGCFRAPNASASNGDTADVRSSAVSVSMTSTRTFSSRSLKRLISAGASELKSSSSIWGLLVTMAAQSLIAARRTFHDVSSSSSSPP